MLPRFIAEDTNPDHLKEYLKFSLNHIKKIEKKNNYLLLKIAEQNQLKLDFGDDFDDQLLKLKKMLFGKSSEKRKVNVRKRDIPERQLLLAAESLVPAPKEEELKEIEEVRVSHKLTNEELGDIAREYGYPGSSDWEEMKIHDESEEIDVKVSSYVRKKHRMYKYRLKASKSSNKEIIVAAKAPKKIVPGSKYSPGFAVEVVSQKYLYHNPLERIRRMMEEKGLKVQCRTLYGLSFFVSCYLEDIAKKIQEDIRNCGQILHMDETPWPVNNKKEKNGYMWVMSNQAGSYYHFAPTRSGIIAKEFLGSYSGPVLTDGYAGYKSHLKDIEGVSLSYCWAHARRKFIEIEANYPKECKKVLDLMGKLFRIERGARSYEELKDLRKKESEEVVEKLKDYFFKLMFQTRKESGLRKAINYALNHWEGLKFFLKNPKIPLTNNEAERTIRHSVIGRKNFHGSRTMNGARTTAILYTVIESCKKVELDPKSYMLMAVRKSLEEKTPKTPLEYAKHIRS